MYKIGLATALFGLQLFHLGAQNIVKVNAILYELITESKASDSIRMITFSGSPSPIANPKALDNIEYIFYIGNGWDYETKELPESWFKLKNLKGIILSNMDYENEAFENARKIKPGLFLSDASFCHIQWHKIQKDTTIKYEVAFETQIRIPYDDELEDLAWKDHWTMADSIFLLEYVLKNELVENVSYQTQIKDSAIKWLHLDEMLNRSSVGLLDSIALHIELPDTVQNFIFNRLQKEGTTQNLNNITFRYLGKYLNNLNEYRPYIDEEFRKMIQLHMERFEQFKLQGYLTEPTIKSLNDILRL